MLAQEQAALNSSKLQTASGGSYVMDEASADAGIPKSSSALLLYVLFFFPAMAAVHTLVITHDGRREKFALSSTVATPGT